MNLKKEILLRYYYKKENIQYFFKKLKRDLKDEWRFKWSKVFTSYFWKDKFHLSLFHVTMREIKKLERIKDENKRYKQLFKFLNYLKNEVYYNPGYDHDVEPDEHNSWKEVYGSLEYFSDRWDWTRLKRVWWFYIAYTKTEQYRKNIKPSFRLGRF